MGALFFVENILSVVSQAEGFPVVNRRTILVQSLLVAFGGVSHIVIPAVLWEFFMKLDHQLVAVILCENRSAGNTEEFCVSFYNALMRDERVRVKAVAVHKNQLWANFQLVQ